MSWFSRRGGTGDRQDKPPAKVMPPGGPVGGDTPGGGALAGNAGGATGAAGAGSVEGHRSLGLAALLASFSAAATRPQVLDLGPAVGGNVEFLSRFACKVFIEDLYPAFAAASGRPSAPASAVPPWDRAAVREARETWEARQEREQRQDGGLADRFANLLQFADDVRFDAVFAWDLLNYLDRQETAALARRLARCCRPGAVVFALISILKQIPAQPMRFRILDAEHLAYEPRTAGLRPCPRYAPAELTELLRGFTLDRSFLLRHGVQEYLFARQRD
jgi:hypothetical protein